MPENLYLQIPDTDRIIYVGNRIKLGRFSADTWLVCFGWYTWGGNRPVCGWYLTKICEYQVPPAGTEIKPLQLTDLIDIYVIET